MAELLSKTASGGAHERYGLEVAATLKAHVERNQRLAPAHRQAVAAEGERVAGCTTRLAQANRPYQEWLARALLPIRAGQRVADFLCDEAQRDAVALARRYPKQIAAGLAGGLGSLWTEKQPSRVMRLGRGATVDACRHTARQLRLVGDEHVPGAVAVAQGLELAADGLHELNEQARRTAEQRAPLRFAVDRAVADLRGELDLMKARLTVAGLSDLFVASLFPELAHKSADPADEVEGEGEEEVGTPA